MASHIPTYVVLDYSTAVLARELLAKVQFNEALMLDASIKMREVVGFAIDELTKATTLPAPELIDAREWLREEMSE
jgi:hypothetical protein